MQAVQCSAVQSGLSVSRQLITLPLSFLSSYIRSRALKLSRLGLFPKVFGQYISKIFKQKYHGNLTIVPRFTTTQTFGLKALSNPTVKDMEVYLKYSQIVSCGDRSETHCDVTNGCLLPILPPSHMTFLYFLSLKATWPYLNAIRDMIRLEKSLDDCLARLEARMRILSPEGDWSNQDDVESIETRSIMASSSTNRVRIIGRPLNGHSFARDRDVEHLRLENQKLREEVDRLRQQLSEKDGQSNESTSGEEKKERDPAATSVSDGGEGLVWNLVRGSTG